MNHIDCKNFLPTDVFKGICKRTKERIIADEAGCNDFEKAPKCRYCSHFSATGENLGLCMDKADAYPDMNASTCNSFAWN
jgi:4-hydroxyphenylacetate decarboxylase small subunit